jgi:hypothetical protein
MKRRFVLASVLTAFAFTGIANATPPVYEDGPVVQTTVKEKADKHQANSNQGDDRQEVAKNDAGEDASKNDSPDPAKTWGNGTLRGDDPRFGANPFVSQRVAPFPDKPRLPTPLPSHTDWWGDSYWKTTRNRAKWEQQSGSAAQ